MWLINLILIFFGIFLLYKGAIYLVKSCVYIAEATGIPKIIIGLTIVALGTSMPELIVNIIGSVQNRPEIVIGNVLGSNINNILLITGVLALVHPIRVKKLVATRDIPFAIVSIIIFALLFSDKLFGGGTDTLSRNDGLVLLMTFFIFIYYVVFSHREHFEKSTKTINPKEFTKKILIGLAGLLIMISGGVLVVENSVLIANMLGVSEKVISLTIVAIGTSLPEFVSTLVALRHGEDEIGIGNIIGSNITNILFIIGISVVITPISDHISITWDIFVMMIATLALFVSLFNAKRYKIDRIEGFFFLIIYVVYVLSLFYLS
jgi:cation:H+ antiporter